MNTHKESVTKAIITYDQIKVSIYPVLVSFIIIVFILLLDRARPFVSPSFQSSCKAKPGKKEDKHYFPKP